MIERYRAIIIKDNHLVVMERHRLGKHFWVFPGGGREKDETEIQCCEREVLEEFGIVVKAKNMIYETTHTINGETTYQGYFVCDWISGEIHKTDAEEYSQKNPEIYGTYNPTSIPLEQIEEYNIMPPEVKAQLINDLNEFGTDLKRPLLKIACEYRK